MASTKLNCHCPAVDEHGHMTRPLLLRFLTHVPQLLSDTKGRCKCETKWHTGSFAQYEESEPSTK